MIQERITIWTHFLFVAWLLLPLPGCPLDENEGIVHYVYDGDTLKVGHHKVRLTGVDTPEVEWKEKNKKAQCYGNEAKSYVQKQLLGKKVRLERDPLSDKNDKYDRLLTYVILDSRLINAELIESGFGYAYTAFPFTKMDQFKKLQKEAQKQKKGMWGKCQVKCKGKFCESLFPR